MPVFLLAAEPVREWKSKTGQTVQASLDDSQETDDPTIVYLLRNGKKYRIPLEKLSPEDQEYVTNARQGIRGIGSDFELVDSEKTDNRGIKITPTPPPTGNKYALLIGVNNYAKPFTSLKYCVQDMELLSKCFQKLGIPKSNIYLITDNAATECLPTGSNIRNQIKFMTSFMREEDQLIVAFSGHGAMVDGESYLCPNDTNLDDNDSIIPRSWVYEQLEKCKAKRKVFIIDACRNEITIGGERALGNTRTLDDQIGLDTHGFILIASCSKSQFSWEHESLKHGVFTYFLAEGLLGKAADDDGYVSVLSLIGYASSKTTNFVHRNFYKNQVPTFVNSGAEASDFHIGQLPKLDTEHAASEPQIRVSDIDNSDIEAYNDLERIASSRGSDGSISTPRMDAVEETVDNIRERVDTGRRIFWKIRGIGGF